MSKNLTTSDIVNIVIGVMIFIGQSVTFLVQIIEFCVKKNVEGASFFYFYFNNYNSFFVTLSCIILDYSTMFQIDKTKTLGDVINSWMAVVNLMTVWVLVMICILQYLIYTFFPGKKKKNDKRKKYIVNEPHVDGGGDGDVNDEYSGKNDDEIEKVFLLDESFKNNQNNDVNDKNKNDKNNDIDKKGKKCKIPSRYEKIIYLILFFVYILIMVLTSGFAVFYIPQIGIDFGKFNHKVYGDICGYISSSFVVVTFLPQIITTFIHGKSGSFSVPSLILLQIGMMFYVIFLIVGGQSFVIWLPQIIGLIETFILIVELSIFWIIRKIKMIRMKRLSLKLPR